MYCTLEKLIFSYNMYIYTVGLKKRKTLKFTDAMYIFDNLVEVAR